MVGGTSALHPTMSSEGAGAGHGPPPGSSQTLLTHPWEGVGEQRACSCLDR